MNPRDLFQVLLRVLGVWFLFYGVKNLVYGIYYAYRMGLAAERAGEYLFPAWPEILIGLYLVSGAKWLVRFCYKERQ